MTAPALMTGAGLAGGLVDLILRISRARGLEDVTSAIRAELRTLLGCDGVTFVLRDGDFCFYAAEDAIGPLWTGQRFPIETCISGWTMLNSRPAVIPDIDMDGRIPHDVYRATFVQSLVMVPVRADDPLAAIGAYWGDRHDATAAEIRALEAVANSAAVALTNIGLITRLEAVSEQKSRFLAACSHDLRQPFQAMRLYLSVLEDRLVGRDGELCHLLGEAMTHGEDLLAALLDLSTLESGLISANPAPTRLTDVFAKLLSIFSGQAGAKGLRLVVRPCACEVVTDPALLTRILGNLVGNAIKYTDRGGVVMGARRRGGTVAIQVWDSGVGIARQNLSRIFEDFYQVGNSARDHRLGIGLGLGIARRLADRLGHPLTVASRPGKGSVFTLAVPLAGE